MIYKIFKLLACAQHWIKLTALLHKEIYKPDKLMQQKRRPTSCEYLKREESIAIFVDNSRN